MSQQPKVRLPRTPGVIRKAEINADGDLEIRGLGILFGGRSLYNDAFEPPREVFGDVEDGVEVGTEYFFRTFSDGFDLNTGVISNADSMPVYHDHGVGVLGSLRIGTAWPTRVTEEGIEYLIKIEKKRAGEYWEMVNELRNEGILGLSAQAQFSTYRAEYGDPGRVRAWRSIEISTTVTPAEPRIAERLRSIFRKYDLPTEEDVTKKIEKPDQLDMPSEEELLRTIEADEVTGENPVDVVNEVMDDVDASMARTAAQVAESDALSALARTVEEQNTEIAAMRSLVEDLTGAVNLLREQNIEAMRTFAERIARSISNDVVRSTARAALSSAEREAVEAALDRDEPEPGTQRSVGNYGIPANAPGQ